MKTCNKCYKVKSEELFCRDKYKSDGLCTKCKACEKVYREANKDRRSAYDKSRAVDFTLLDEAKRSECRVFHYTSKRRKSPKWLNDEDRWLISEIYETCLLRSKLTGVKHNVDHIIPLNGRLVTGLHVPENLCVITARENQAKSNKFAI